MSPLVSICRTLATGVFSVGVSSAWGLLSLLFDVGDEVRFVRDRVLTTLAVCADSIAAVSFASSNVSYRVITISRGLGSTVMQVKVPTEDTYSFFSSSFFIFLVV